MRAYSAALSFFSTATHFLKHLFRPARRAPSGTGMDTTPRTRRWSQVVPPHTALTFAVMWDPVEGMITFSNEKLLDNTEAGEHTPRDALSDAHSQVLTLDRLTLPLPSGMYACSERHGHYARAALDDRGSVVDPHMRRASRVPDEQEVSEASVYSQESAEPRRPRPSTSPAPTSHGDTSTARASTARRKRAEQLQALGKQIFSVVVAPFERNSGVQYAERRTRPADDGLFEDAPWTDTGSTAPSAPVLVNMNLKSAFSFSTASTSAFVNISTPIPTPLASAPPTPGATRSFYDIPIPAPTPTPTPVPRTPTGTARSGTNTSAREKPLPPVRTHAHVPPPIVIQLPTPPPTSASSHTPPLQCIPTPPPIPIPSARDRDAYAYPQRHSMPEPRRQSSWDTSIPNANASAQSDTEADSAIDVDVDVAHEGCLPSSSSASRGTQRSRRPTRRLRKRRPTGAVLPVDPAEVLARPEYNHTASWCGGPVTGAAAGRRTPLRRERPLPRVPVPPSAFRYANERLEGTGTGTGVGMGERAVPIRPSAPPASQANPSHRSTSGIRSTSRLPLPSPPSSPSASPPPPIPHPASPNATATSASHRATKSVKHQRSMVSLVRSTVDRLAGCGSGASAQCSSPALRCTSIAEGAEELWVCVNVAHKVTQYVCTLDLDA